MPTRSASWTGDVRGGFAAALLALSVEIAYGLFAVAPLGPTFAGHGLHAALWACILGGIVGFLLRSNGGMISGTRPATALILASLASALLARAEIASQENSALHVMALMVLCTALAGLFQLIFGLVRAGRVLKYVPFPVTAGLMAGIGALMFLNSIRPALGASNQTAWLDLFGTWHPASTIVAGVAFATCTIAQRFNSPIPGSVLALFTGSLTHHGLAALLGNGQLGGTSIALAGILPDVTVWTAGINIAELVGWLPMLVPYALTIAIFGSLETLLCLSVIGSAVGKRPDGDRELRVQGMTNFFAGLAGATPGVGNLSRVNVNIANGGRTRLSYFVYALAIAILILLAGELLALVPHSVTAAIVTYYAFAMIDDGTRRISKQLFVQRKAVSEQYYRVLLANFSVIALVAAVAVLGDMVQAAGVGFVATTFLFVQSRIKPAVRRVTFGDTRRSHKVRSAADMDRLARQGRRTVVIEAEGPLFFGTADSIAGEIERHAAEADRVIVDLRRVQDIDPTGARTLLQAARYLADKKKRMLLSGMSPLFGNMLSAMGIEHVVPREDWHFDLDHALEIAEDWLLGETGGGELHRTIPLAETSLADGLDRTQSDVLEGFLIKRRCDRATTLFEMGQRGDSLLVTGGGSVDILLPLKDGQQKRLVSLSPGVIFGELALLEGQPRSTSAVLVEESVVWELTRAAFDALLDSHPRIARQVLFNVGRQLAGRLRAITGEMALLEEGG